MSQGGYVTLVGFVAREPRLRQLVDGRHVTEVRVGTTTRVLDRLTNEWRDGDTSYYTVNCWRRLADHVNASLHKGDPVMVKGRFKTRSYEDKAGRLRTEVEIVADTVGHDLNRGVANYIRQHRPRTEEADGRTTGEAGGRTAGESTDTVEAAEDIDVIDEEAIEQFGRELEAGLDDAARGLDDEAARGLDDEAARGLDDEAARGLDDDTEAEPEIQPAQNAVPPVPQVPF